MGWNGAQRAADTVTGHRRNRDRLITIRHPEGCFFAAKLIEQNLAIYTIYVIFIEAFKSAPGKRKARMEG
ncbi:MAG: hypothetical protein K0S39_5345 [Paenibacillus sp.]|jgi:hypothetical protein|nr:hypothetical protein [Paenibacillus sp.]